MLIIKKNKRKSNSKILNPRIPLGAGPFSRYNDEIWKKKRTKFAVGRKNHRMLSRTSPEIREALIFLGFSIYGA